MIPYFPLIKKVSKNCNVNVPLFVLKKYFQGIFRNLEHFKSSESLIGSA